MAVGIAADRCILMQQLVYTWQPVATIRDCGITNDADGKYIGQGYQRKAIRAAAGSNSQGSGCSCRVSLGQQPQQGELRSEEEGW